DLGAAEAGPQARTRLAAWPRERRAVLGPPRGSVRRTPHRPRSDVSDLALLRLAPAVRAARGRGGLGRRDTCGLARLLVGGDLRGGLRGEPAPPAGAGRRRGSPPGHGQ